MKLLFSKIERYLLNNQTDPFVIYEKKGSALIDDFEETENIEFPTLTNQPSIYNKLAIGIFLNKKLAKQALQVKPEKDKEI